jgi:hypothetical protein
MPTEAAEALHPSSSRKPATLDRALLLTRVAWGILVALALLVFLGSIPAYLSQLQTVCSGAVCQDLQLNAAGVQILHAHGVSLAKYAYMNLAFDLVWALAYFALGTLLARRASSSWWLLLVSFWMILQGTTTVTLIAGESTSLWQYPALIANTSAFILLWLVFFLFPDGQFRPRWTAWFFGGISVIGLMTLIWPENTLLQFVFSFGGVFCVIPAQIYRYRRISTQIQRQQTKWVVYSIIGVTSADLIVMLPNVVGVASSKDFGGLYPIISDSLVTVFTFLIPVSFAIALMRYRLWDIDRLVNRALVYGALTAILASIYFAIVLGVQAVARYLSGQQGNQPVVIVLTTLLVAALFAPLRRRIQALIDRAFNRSRYDAARTLTAFGAQLRTETDLEELHDRLLEVVHQTIQPAHVSLWLRTPSRGKD